MASTISPNMSLILPTVGSEPGPDYAFDVNSSLTLIDQHDHSLGQGVQITPSGLNINATLDIQNNNLIRIDDLTFTSQLAASSTAQTLSVAPGSGTGTADLFFTDGNGTQIQITKSGIVNVVAASIPGESYSGGTFIWTQEQSSLPTTPANFDIGSITIRPNTAGTTNGLTLIPPAGISSAYTLTLPNRPSLLPNTSFLTITQAGVIAGTNSIDQGIVTGNIADGAITAAKLATGIFDGFVWQSQTFSGSGTFNVPPRVSTVFVLGAGGGGGGGGRMPLIIGGESGGGGGSGAHPYLMPVTVTPSGTVTVTIGAGGAGGGSGVTGSTGGATSFGSLIFPGASGGAVGASDGSTINIYAKSNAIKYTDNGGGAAGGTDFGAPGAGAVGSNSSFAGNSAGGTASGTGSGGGGGGAGWGIGGAGGASSTAGGNNGTAAAGGTSAGGGGGGGPGSTGGAGTGGAGGSGKIIVYWLPGPS